MSFHVLMSDRAGALTVSLVMARVASGGGETAVESPLPIQLTGPDVVSFNDGPIAVGDLCAGLDPGDYIFRIVSADGKTKLAEGPVTFTP